MAPQGELLSESWLHCVLDLFDFDCLILGLLEFVKFEAFVAQQRNDQRLGVGVELNFSVGLLGWQFLDGFAFSSLGVPENQECLAICGFACQRRQVLRLHAGRKGNGKPRCKANSFCQLQLPSFRRCVQFIKADAGSLCGLEAHGH